jgi:protein-L-isoaspartate O-methyltransferase
VISFEAVRSFMSVDYFEEQRRQMVAAIRAITDHVAQISKSELDNRVLQAMAKVPRHEFVPVEVSNMPT